MKKNKSLRTRLLLSLFAILLVLAMVPSTAFAAAEDGQETLDVSRSKTATPLTDDYQTEVTLSLPSAEESLVSDVVFIVDSSSCGKLSALGLYDALGKLADQVGKTSAKVQVGIVTFRGTAQTFPLEELTPTYVEKIKDTIAAPAVKGSNMHAGLIAAKKMLSESSTSADRQYVILISDGIIYSWDEDGVQTGAPIQYMESERVEFPSNSDYELYHQGDGGLGWHPENENWRGYLNSISDIIAKTIADISEPYTRDHSKITKYIPRDKYDEYACSPDIAMFKALNAWDEFQSYHRYLITNPSGQYGESFMNALDGSHEINFDAIQNDINYMLDKGSSVKDTIGSGFELSDLESLRLTVDGEEIAKSIDGNTVYFGKDDAGYRFKVEYDADANTLTWDINEPISNFAPVQLHYTLKLKNPKTDAGTYGVLDLNGDGIIDDSDSAVSESDALYTNESAMLTPVDTRGKTYSAIAFPKPSVCYTIKADDPGKDDPGKDDPKKDDTSKDKKKTNPDTGDATNLMPWLSLLLLSTCGLGASAIAGKREFF